MATLSRRKLLQLAGLAGGLGVARTLTGCARMPPIPAFCDLPGVPAADLGQFDHVVVLMLENRSLDNLLGFLYEPGQVPRGQTFEGVAGQDLSNPIPPYADQADRGFVPVGQGSVTDDPNPDPGEEYPHINTQLFGTVLPAANRFRTGLYAQAPFNVPAPRPDVAPMNGFLTDYINNFPIEAGRNPTYDEYKVIMNCFPPDVLPAVSTLARQFAVCDHWHCEVPSQTFCNRSFFHTGTSSGFVTNAPYNKWLHENNAETIFERLEACPDRGLSWRVYFDRQDIASATALIHFQRLRPFFRTNFAYMDQFYADVRAGRLPSYTFIEPRLLFNHNDMHPPARILGRTQPSTVSAGDELVANIYEAIRTSDNPQGSHFQNTLLVITFDEHGGCYDHVSPPAATPPDAVNRPLGQMDFAFDRLGVRVPAILISAYIDSGTVVNTPLQHTSVIRTMCRKWGLPALTDRDASANDLANAFNRATPRPQSDWPVLVQKSACDETQAAASGDLPLNRLQRDVLGLVAALRGDEAPPPEIGTVGAALDYVRAQMATAGFGS